jgi:hypothetical protein
MIVWHIYVNTSTHNQGVYACSVVILTIGYRFVPLFKMEDFETKIFNVVDNSPSLRARVKGNPALQI